MRRHGIMFVMLFAGIALAARAEAKKGLGFELYGGWSSYQMSQMNDSLASFDALVGTDFAAIDNGALAGGAFRFGLNERVLMRVGFEHWFAQTTDDDLEFDVGVWALPITATYWLSTDRSWRFGLGAGVVPYNISGAFLGNDFKFDASGSGFAGQLMGEVERSLGSGWSLSAVAGYRFAKADVLELEDQPIEIRPDYSGPWVRLGIAIDGR